MASRSLPVAQCMSMLASTQIGRVVVTQKALPAAFPVIFVILDGDIVFATTAGSKLEAATAEQVVAFEVDEIDPFSQAGWSVLVQGHADVVDDAMALARVRALRLVPWAGGTEFRAVRVRTEILSGRRLLPGTQCQGFREGRACSLGGPPSSLAPS